jgi:hypothetical protein
MPHPLAVFFLTQAQRGDYVSKVATVFKVPIETILSNNGPDAIPDPQAFLTPGRRIRVCNPTAGTYVSSGVWDQIYVW